MKIGSIINENEYEGNQMSKKSKSTKFKKVQFKQSNNINAPFSIQMIKGNKKIKKALIPELSKMKKIKLNQNQKKILKQ